MKFAVLALAVVAAAEGDDCSADATVCDADGLTCASWTDAANGAMMTCQDCTEDVTTTDSTGGVVAFDCAPSAGEEGASSLFASVAAVLAVSTIMA